MLTYKPLWKLSTPWQHTTRFSHKEIGDLGEDLAVEHLKACGYKVLYRNFNPPQGGEIDIICRKDDTLVFIEVKTRLGATNRRPVLAINHSKRSQLKKGALQYIRMLEQKVPYRYDAVEVILRNGDLPELNIVEFLEIP